MTMFRIAALIALASPAACFAQPSLTASTPAEGTSVPRTDRIQLAFSEAIDIKTSSVQLVMTSMPGMTGNHQMKMNAVAVTLGKDGQSLVITAKNPFPVGTYSLDWSATGKADQAQAKGQLTFSMAPGA